MRRFNRRRFLHLTGAAVTGGVITAVAPTELLRLANAGLPLRWSDPSTWGRRVPGEDDVAIIRGRILLDVDTRVGGVQIASGGELIFDPDRRITLQTTGNVVVQGRLTMRPSRPSVRHRMTFVNVDEGLFGGGGMDVLASDVGLWVMDGGTLNIAGTKKLAWTRTSKAVQAGVRTITLESDPIGWRKGDEIVIAPSDSPAVAGHESRYDQPRISAINGRTIELSQSTQFTHPEVTVAPGVVMAPEVLNLTRNVVIEGTSSGRSHVFIHSSRRQMVGHATFRYMGPRQPSADGFTQLVLGRYGLHFHHCKNGSRRSLVNGVVIRDCGSHAFVPHMSHGISIRNCISHNTYDDAYWWDRPDLTNDTLITDCVASMTRYDPDFRGFQLSGFSLGFGSGNAMRRCVAVGVQGNVNAAGFNWPEGPVNIPSVWVFEDCVAHNNRTNGIFTWQNNSETHVITRYIAYHNGQDGIEHGAYKNRYVYRNSTLYGNRRSAVAIHATSLVPPSLRFENLLCDGGGLPDYAVFSTLHNAAGDVPTEVVGCTFRGFKKAAFACTFPANPFGDVFLVKDCTFEGNEFWLDSAIHPDSSVEVRDPVHGAIILRRFDAEGQFRPEWNAAVTVIT